MSSDKRLEQTRQSSTQVAFRLDFCSPAYLNSLLRQQHLHWLELYCRTVDGPGKHSTVYQFLFVIPSSLPNLVCVLGTEAPLLKAQIGCQLRRVPTPDYIVPDGLLTFSVEYNTDQASGGGGGAGAHAKFIGALKQICVRLQLTNICLGPIDSRNGSDWTGDNEKVSGGCAACFKLRTHTKSVRGYSSAPRMHRQTAPPPHQKQHKQQSVQQKQQKPGKDVTEPWPRIMMELATELLLQRLRLTEYAICAVAKVKTAELLTMSYCAQEMIDSTVEKWHVLTKAVSVFTEWSADLADRLLAGCVRLATKGTDVSQAAAARVAESTADQLLSNMTSGPLIVDLVAAERSLFRVCLPCDQRTSRLLLSGQQPLRRKCHSCGASIIAEEASRFGSAYRLTIRSRFAASCHNLLLQLAESARKAMDSGLGSLLLQRIASLPVDTDAHCA